VATAVAAGPTPLVVQALRDTIPPSPRDGIGALTAIDGTIVARCLARNGEEAREWLSELWAAVRPLVTGLPASPPRIWRT
jgi:urease accessory protein